MEWISICQTRELHFWHRQYFNSSCLIFHLFHGTTISQPSLEFQSVTLGTKKSVFLLTAETLTGLIPFGTSYNLRDSRMTVKKHCISMIKEKYMPLIFPLIWELIDLNNLLISKKNIFQKLPLRCCVKFCREAYEIFVD